MLGDELAAEDLVHRQYSFLRDTRLPESARAGAHLIAAIEHVIDEDRPGELATSTVRDLARAAIDGMTNADAARDARWHYAVERLSAADTPTTLTLRRSW